MDVVTRSFTDVPESLGQFIPRLGIHRRDPLPELDRILAGVSHAPVVYFIRIGQHVKIGTSTNLRGRTRSFYLSLDDVLAVVPGGKPVEDLFHERFAGSRIAGDDRAEVFEVDFRMRLYLAGCRCSWPQVAQSVAVALTVWTALFALALFVGAWAEILAPPATVLTALAGIVMCCARPGWDWQRPLKNKLVATVAGPETGSDS